MEGEVEVTQEETHSLPLKERLLSNAFALSKQHKVWLFIIVLRVIVLSVILSVYILKIVHCWINAFYFPIAFLAAIIAYLIYFVQRRRGMLDSSLIPSSLLECSFITLFILAIPMHFIGVYFIRGGSWMVGHLTLRTDISVSAPIANPWIHVFGFIFAFLFFAPLEECKKAFALWISAKYGIKAPNSLKSAHTYIWVGLSFGLGYGTCTGIIYACFTEYPSSLYMFQLISVLLRSLIGTPLQSLWGVLWGIGLVRKRLLDDPNKERSWLWIGLVPWFVNGMFQLVCFELSILSITETWVVVVIAIFVWLFYAVFIAYVIVAYRKVMTDVKNRIEEMETITNANELSVTIKERDLEVSAFFAALDTLLALYLWRRDMNTDRWWAVITMFPALVQIGDLAMWYEHRFDPDYQSGVCSSFNQGWTAFQILFTASQPIWYYLASVYYRRHTLGVSWPVISVSDVLISMMPALCVIPTTMSSYLSDEFNPCLSENPGIHFCSHLTEDGHWIWAWGLDQWGGGLCGRKDREMIMGLPWNKEDPRFFAKQNRIADMPQFAKVLSTFMWTISARWAQPRAAGLLQVVWLFSISLLALPTTSYGNMWCFLANSAGFIGLLNPYILRLFGYDCSKVGQSHSGKAGKYE